MKKLLLVAASVLAIAAACTQKPVQVVLKGDQFFGRDQQVASNNYNSSVGFRSGNYPSQIQVRQEPTAEAQRVGSVGVSDLPPLPGEYQPTAFVDTARPEGRAMAAPSPQAVERDLAEIKITPAAQTNDSAARFAPAAIQVESPNGATDVSQNWYQGKVVLAKADVPDQVSVPVSASPGARFIWPVHGKIISHFGPKTNGLHNDGINIAANAGEPVYAAADGVVVYAGNDLKGYGNMTILRHENGWMTAYAHTENLLVNQNERVRQGQRIATVGATGSVESAQLHFGLRNGKTPVDPARYLNADVAAR